MPVPTPVAGYRCETSPDKKIIASCREPPPKKNPQQTKEQQLKSFIKKAPSPYRSWNSL